MHLSPELVIGRSRLFSWNNESHTITLSDPFQALLNLLIELKIVILNSDCQTLEGLNRLLQQELGKGGLLRKNGSERWEVSDKFLTDNPLWEARIEEFMFLLGQLGFINKRPCDGPISVEHSLILGARVERMKMRIKETVQLLKERAVKTEKLFLLGSKRPLENDEKISLKLQIESIKNPHLKSYWENIFVTDDLCTEGNAFVCLWDCLAPDSLKEELGSNMIPTHSTVIGFSYQEIGGHRTTTDVTTNDWALHYYDDEKPQAIFAMIEQPYGRLPDQLADSVITNAKKATVDLMMSRVANTTFHFAVIEPPKVPLAAVQFDEIARNVYRTVLLVRYLETL